MSPPQLLGTTPSMPSLSFLPRAGGWALNMKDLKLLQIIGKGEFGGEPHVPNTTVALRWGGVPLQPPQGDGGAPGCFLVPPVPVSPGPQM